MNTRAAGNIVVGVDGSASSLAAVRSAAEQAADQERRLRVVHAFIWPSLKVATGPAAGGPSETGLRHQAQQLLDEAVDEAQKAAPQLQVEARLVDGAAVPVLLRESRDAALLVLGDRGLGAFSGLLIGSVAVQAAAHAACPVMVVRHSEHRRGPVLLGVEGSETSALAMDFAVQEADRRQIELVALHAWLPPVSIGPGKPLVPGHDPDTVEQKARRMLDELLADWSERHPEVTIHAEVVPDRPGHALVERSKSAQLVVVGARGRGGFTGLLLGSVSQTLLYYSACSVVVVRGTLPRS